MDIVISQIVNIEKKAREMTDDIKKQYANIDDIIDEEISTLRKELYNKADARLEKNKKTEEEYCKKTIAELDEQQEKILNDLNSSNSQKKSEWANMIFDNVINSIGG